jgi:hypothetical protein
MADGDGRGNIWFVFVRIEFVDEQLEVCQQQGTSAEAITTQPHSLYAIPDLNKLLHLTGIRLFTDVFSR